MTNSAVPIAKALSVSASMGKGNPARATGSWFSADVMRSSKNIPFAAT